MKSESMIITHDICSTHCSIDRILVTFFNVISHEETLKSRIFDVLKDTDYHRFSKGNLINSIDCFCDHHIMHRHVVYKTFKKMSFFAFSVIRKYSDWCSRPHPWLRQCQERTEHSTNIEGLWETWFEPLTSLSRPSRMLKSIHWKHSLIALKRKWIVW